MSLLHFSKWMLLSNFVGYFKSRSTDFFLGRMHGPAALGLFNVSYEFSNLPTSELSAPINRALLPGFAKMETPGEVKTAYLNTLGLLASLALPAAAGIFTIAPLLATVVLGSKWTAAGAVMQVLALHGALALSTPTLSAS